MRNFEKIVKANRLEYGETDEKRERRDKRHKPKKVPKLWCPDKYDHKLKQRIAEKQRLNAR